MREPKRTFAWQEMQGAAGGLVSSTPPVPVPRCRLPASAFPAVVVVLTPTIFHLLRRWVLHYLPITGTAVDGQQGLSTHRWAFMPRLWGPLPLRDPVQLSLGPQRTSYHVCHEEECMRSWQWRAGYVPAEETYALGSSFRP